MLLATEVLLLDVKTPEGQTFTENLTITILAVCENLLQKICYMYSVNVKNFTR